MLVNDNKATPVPTSWSSQATTPTPTPMSKPAAGSSSPAPPDYYRTYNSLHQNQFSDPHVPLRVGGQSGSPRWRFFKTLVVAIGVWIAVGFVARQIVRMAMHNHNGWGSGDNGESTGPFPDDGHVVRCIKGSDWIHDSEHPPRQVGWGEYEVTTSFSMPVDAEELYFLSRGSRSFGDIEILPVYADDVKEEGKVFVQVNATYNNEDVIEAAELCLFEQNDKHGLGIFTPRRNWPSFPNKRLNWKVRVAIPAGADIKALTTKMPIFPHHVHGEGLTFDKLTLTTSNAAIRLDAINATTLTAQTSNAPISGDIQAVKSHFASSNGKLEGAFNVTERLVLKTSNSPIAAQITLNNADEGVPTIAELSSSNGKIEAEFFLKSTVDVAKNKGGAFDVSGRTSNSPVALVVSEIPLNSKPTVIAHSSNGRASAYVAPAFEGRFYVRTSNGQVTLNTPSSKSGKGQDPSGEGRERHVRQVEWDRKRQSVAGTVFWGEREEKDVPRGSVVVETSNSNAELTI